MTRLTGIARGSRPRRAQASMHPYRYGCTSRGGSRRRADGMTGAELSDLPFDDRQALVLPVRGIADEHVAPAAVACEPLLADQRLERDGDGRPLRSDDAGEHVVGEAKRHDGPLQGHSSPHAREVPQRR